MSDVDLIGLVLLNDYDSVEEFIRKVYSGHIDDAEIATAKTLEQLQGWESKMNLLTGLVDFHLWPTSELLMSKVREHLLHENPLVFVAAAQLMVRGNIPFNDIEDSLPEKRLMAIDNIRTQFLNNFERNEDES